MTPPRALGDLAGPLAEWIGARLAEAGIGPGPVVVTDLERPAAGQSNDTMAFTATWPGGSARLVVRRQAGDNKIFRDADVLREARVLDGLRDTAVRVPSVRWTEPDPSVLGAQFFVMDHVAGRVPHGKPSIHSVGWLPTLTATEREALWCSAMDTLVAVHEVDWRRRHSFLLDGHDGDSTASAYVDWLLDWYRWTAAGREFPVTDAAAETIEARRSALGDDAAVLVWGDARVGNMIFGPDHRVAAAIDWEVASIGPAARDVAHWLFFDEFATGACGVERLKGWPDRDETVSRYESGSGRRLGDLDLFEMMEELFMATTLIRQADARAAAGLAPGGTRMGHDNTVTQMLARRLGLPVPELSPDYLAHRGMPVP
ncbi:MAG TPA: phosphotransferase family protein [Acidimicrobiales bacterium]|nr:phosphotransferase family protein [Acidimicrobiales bacterium]